MVLTRSTTWTLWVVLTQGSSLTWKLKLPKGIVDDHWLALLRIRRHSLLHHLVYHLTLRNLHHGGRIEHGKMIALSVLPVTLSLLIFGATNLTCHHAPLLTQVLVFHVVAVVGDRTKTMIQDLHYKDEINPAADINGQNVHGNVHLKMVLSTGQAPRTWPKWPQSLAR